MYKRKGYTGSTGRYHVPAYAARNSSGNSVTPAVALPDYEEWAKSINGPLSGSSPRYANTNHADSAQTHGETAYQRSASDYYFSGYPSQPQIYYKRLMLVGTDGLNDSDRTDDEITSGLASDGSTSIQFGYAMDELTLTEISGSGKTYGIPANVQGFHARTLGMGGKTPGAAKITFLGALITDQTITITDGNGKSVAYTAKTAQDLTATPPEFDADGTTCLLYTSPSPRD